MLAVLAHATLAFSSHQQAGFTFVTPEGFTDRGYTTWEEAYEDGPGVWPQGWPADVPCIKLFTWDFDGTTEFTDELSTSVSARATEEEKLTDLVPAYERLKAEVGGLSGIVDTYFGGASRIVYMNEGIAAISHAGGQVYIDSASWAPTPGSVWASYLYHVRRLPHHSRTPAPRGRRPSPRQVLGDVGMPFPMEKIIGVDDPGPGIAADKATPAMKLADELGVPHSQMMHTDNSFKYDTEFIKAGAYGLYPAPTPVAHIQQPELKFMLAEAQAC